MSTDLLFQLNSWQSQSEAVRPLLPWSDRAVSSWPMAGHKASAPLLGVSSVSMRGLEVSSVLVPTWLCVLSIIVTTLSGQGCPAFFGWVSFGVNCGMEGVTLRFGCESLS